MKTLYYFTIGYSVTYIPCLNYAIQSLLKYKHKDSDIIVLIDESLLEIARNSLPPLTFISCSDSLTPEEASMRKLTIFDYSIEQYDAVIFIDSDIIIQMDIETLAPLITAPDQLYVSTENTDFTCHTHLNWSLCTYTEENLQFIKDNKIMIFNAGLFAFRPTDIMKTHFSNLREMIKNHTGPFFYEQSFMNVYFNLLNNTNRDVFTDANYKLFPLRNINYEGKIIHFCGEAGVGKTKYDKMKIYTEMFNVTTL